VKSFDELKLSAALMRAIADLGYTAPSPIQQQALPILLGPATDFLGLAATGTGKTAAFGIPLLEKMDHSSKAVQGIVLCPTRELALQVTGQINLLGKFVGVRALPIYGGAPYGDQIRGLKNGVGIVVGTPGRIIDHINKGTLNLSDVKTVILDEADEMISMGFKDDLELILQAAPRESSNIWLFSATMSKEVRRVADEYLRDPEHVQVNRTEMVPSTIEQLYYPVRESDKPEVLCKLIEAADSFYGLIFCQTKALVTDLNQYLVNRGYKVDCLHGDKDQNSRERTMQAFRDKKVTILVCTDVASRGLDVKDITHVVNYSIPRELDNYVHRIGRTARSGKSGIAMSLVSASNRGLISRVEAMTKSRMKEGKIPTRKDIGMKKTSKLLTQFQGQKFHARASEILGDDWKTTIAEMSPEEIVGRFVSLISPELFEDREKAKPYSSMPGPSASADAGGPRGRGGRREDDRGERPPQRRFRRPEGGGDRDRSDAGGRSARPYAGASRSPSGFAPRSSEEGGGERSRFSRPSDSGSGGGRFRRSEGGSRPPARSHRAER
jgi:ATP-dependent RNA helicase DeaD